MASDNIQNNGRKMEEMRWKKEAVRNSWAEQEDKSHVQEQGKKKNRSEMRKPPKPVRCTLFNGSARCTERKYMRRHKGTFDIFFGNEHRMRREKMEEQFNKETKQGWRFAADAAKITDENAGSEDRRHTAGGVFAAVCEQLLTKKKEQSRLSQGMKE